MGWIFYGDKFLRKKVISVDPLEKLHPDVYAVLREKFRIDELYEVTIFRLNRHAAAFCSWLDQYIWGGMVQLVGYATLLLSWFNRFFDEYVINLGFDASCREVRNSANMMSRLQDGQIQHYLRVIAIALTLLVLILAWGWKS
jgi:NADH-quinone oxidoreductase subunit L